MRIGIIILLLMCFQVFAIEIPIENYSGEINDNIDRQVISDPAVTGWDGLGQVILGEVAPDNGDWRLSIEDSGYIFNMTEHYISAGDQFTLTFDSSSFSGLPESVTAQLYVDDNTSKVIIHSEIFNFSVLERGIWQTFILTFDVPRDAEYIGKTIGIQFVGPDGGDARYLSVDDIHLDLQRTGQIIISPFDTPIRLFEREQSSCLLNITLNMPPLADVVINMSVNPSGQVAIADNSPLVFTPLNWNQPQQIQLNAVNDSDIEGTQIINLLLDSSSPDSFFDNLQNSDCDITIIDDDKAGITIDTPPEILVDEVGSKTIQYQFFIHKQFQGSLSLIIEDTADPDQVEIIPNSFTFSSSDWFETRTVTIRAIDDDILEDLQHNTILSHRFIGDDSEYLSIDPIDLQVIIVENDCGAWGYVAADINKDCIVDFADFAIIASEWLSCSWPGQADCVNYLP
ncbi:MAG: hypothetical protein JEZ07_04690 [Phycisphaerae bacterium]|nr:hypothetical protein [Phycisphaerae bacterium]